MIETLLNGRLDAWWEYGMLILISIPIWFPFFQLLVLINLKITAFVISMLLGRLT